MECVESIGSHVNGYQGLMEGGGGCGFDAGDLTVVMCICVRVCVPVGLNV